MQGAIGLVAFCLSPISGPPKCTAAHKACVSAVHNATGLSMQCVQAGDFRPPQSVGRGTVEAASNEVSCNLSVTLLGEF